MMTFRIYRRTPITARRHHTLQKAGRQVRANETTYQKEHSVLECCVRVVSVEHEALGIRKPFFCLKTVGPSTTSVITLYSAL